MCLVDQIKKKLSEDSIEHVEIAVTSNKSKYIRIPFTS